MSDRSLGAELSEIYNRAIWLMIIGFAAGVSLIAGSIGFLIGRYMQ